MLQGRLIVDASSMIIIEDTFDLLNELNHLFARLSRRKTLDDLSMLSPRRVGHLRLNTTIRLAFRSRHSLL